MPPRDIPAPASSKPKGLRLLVAAVLAAGVLLLVVFAATPGPTRLTEAEVSPLLDSAEKSLAGRNREAARETLAPLAKPLKIDSRTLIRAAQVAIEAEAGELADTLLTRLDDSGRSREARFLRGVLAMQQHRARDADRWWREAVGDQPDFAPAWERLCQLYMTQIRGDDLRWAMEGLSRVRPLTLDELVVYTTAYEPYYSAEERLETVRQYAAADSDDLGSLAAVARYQSLQGNMSAAIATLEGTRTADPDGVILATRVDATLQQDVEAAARLLPRPDKAADEPLPIARARGLVALRQYDWHRGAASLERVAEARPLDTPVLYQLAQALERLEQRAAAEALLARVQKQEQVNNLVFRIRKTTHLPMARLAPLVLDVSRLLAEIDRGSEGMLWLRAIAGPSVDRPQWETAMARCSAAPAAPRLTLPRIPPPHAPGEETMAKSLGRNRAFSAGEPQPIPLEERQDAAGIDFRYDSGAIGQKWLLETLGGGAAVLDYDGDGWPDLYFAQGGPLGPDGKSPAPRPTDRLYRNLGSGRFQDVTRQAGLGDTGYSHGCTAGDFDNDGDPDLLVANFGECVLYRNEGDGTFVDVTRQARLRGERWHTSAAFADLDGDGSLDLYVVTYVNEPYKTCRRPDGTLSACSPANYTAQPDVLYRNRGDGTFEEISESAGILVPDGKGLGIVVADLDDDGRPDIYVTNDGTPNFLFRNEGVDASGNLKFEEIAMRAGCAVNAHGQSQAGMGIACVDFDGDRRLDLVTTNFFNEGATYYHNHGSDLFEDLTATSGLLEPTRRLLGFGTQPVDLDNSGRFGLMIANGHIDDFGDRHEPWKMRPQAFAGDGGGHFQERNCEGNRYFSQEMLGRAVIRGDFNRDLRTDLVVTHLDRPAALLQNTAQTGGRAIALDLVGIASNRDARGTQVTIVAAGVTHLIKLTGGDGYLASNERKLTVGIGAAGKVDVRIRWPNGKESEQTDVPADSSWRVVEGVGFFSAAN